MVATATVGNAASDQYVRAYFTELPELLNRGLEGQYAIINRGEVRDWLKSYDAAMDAGYERYGRGAFMVKLITKADLDEQERSPK